MNTTEMKILQDTDPMPFGQYKGKPMLLVPARYLHWLWQEIQHDKTSDVGGYIRRNLSLLKQEYPDGVWT